MNLIKHAVCSFVALTSILSAQLSSATLGPNDIGVIVNDSDPDSVTIANYYQLRRNIPASNIIHVSFPVTPTTYSLDPAVLNQIRASVNATAPNVQALAIAWTVPFRVVCMSITSAVARGYDASVCSTPGLYPTRTNPYFDSSSPTPYNTYGIRPAMMLAGTSVDKVKALIDRGVASDSTHPTGTGYLLKTSDTDRSPPRDCAFPRIVSHLSGQIGLQSLNADYIQNKPGVLFYFTGVISVLNLNTNSFIPGAIADHLTSCGGFLAGPSCGQTTALNWLEGGASGTGATASYGTVEEPHNYTEKFPSPRAVIQHYLSGDTVIEAYWKSVIMPDEGVFVGEPLAAPFK